MNSAPPDSSILSLGPCRYPSPLGLNTADNDDVWNFTSDKHRIRGDVNVTSSGPELLFEKAGPRESLFFDPAKTKAAIVTCGGLCPGLNNVIRSVTLELCRNYGLSEVQGIPYGYQGLGPSGTPVVPLTPLDCRRHR